jgi:DHA2 family multidrug resistance protein
MNGQAQRSGRGSDPLSRSAAGGRNPWLVAVVISIATFMQVLDTSIANVALHYIAGSLAASVDESTWILTSYLVASAVILPSAAGCRAWSDASASTWPASPPSP